MLLINLIPLFLVARLLMTISGEERSLQLAILFFIDFYFRSREHEKLEKLEFNHR